jgi:competence protein ComEC
LPRLWYTNRVRNGLALILARQYGRFSLFLPVSMGAGICVYFSLTAEPPLIVAGAATLVLAMAAAVLWRQPYLRAPLLAATFAALGFALATLETARDPPFTTIPRHAVQITGRISEILPLPHGRRVTLTAATIDAAPVLRALRLRLRDTDTAPLDPGDAIAIRALLQPPPPPDLPGGRDTQREAFFTNLAAYGFAIGPTRIAEHTPQSGLATLRGHLANRIMTLIPGAQGAIASTLLTGMGSAIPPRDRAAFDASGLSHLLAVAGLHIGIVMGLCFFTIRLALASSEYAVLHWPCRQIASVAALLAGFLYLEITGAHIPILRSFAMAALVTLGGLTGRRAISLRGLAIAALLLMTSAPHLVMGVSFQMSFSAVLWLIAGYELVRPRLATLGLGTWWRLPVLYGAGLALSSVLAGTGSLPFAAYHFGRASLYYVPANMLAVPLTAFWVMPWGLLALLLWPLGIGGLALHPMAWGISGLLAIAHGVAAWPDANLPVPQPPAWGLALVALGFALAGLLRGPERLLGAIPVLAGLIAPFCLPLPDAYIGPGAHVIAVRVQGRVFADVADNATDFERQAPLRLWGITYAPGLASGLACTENACRAGPILIATSEAVQGCAAPLIITRFWFHDACPGTVADRAFVQTAGATAIRLSGAGVVMTSDAALRGVRPWVIGTRSKLPAATTE